MSNTEPDLSPSLSVVIPIVDEEENLHPVIEEIREVFEGQVAFEVIAVDDGSQDETPERLEELAQRYSWLKTIRHRRNQGKSAALVSGALAARGPWIATMDGDGQNDPRDLLAMWRRVEQVDREGRALLVAGWRQKRADTKLKQISSRVANRVRAGLLGDGTPDTACGMKILEREVFLRLPRFRNMHRFLPALVIREGGLVVSVPVTDRLRAHGESKYGFHNRLWVGIDDLLGVMWLRRRPLVEVEAPSGEVRER